MSLHAILEAIRASGEAQVGRVEAEANTQVRQILAGATLAAQEVQEEACAAASAPAHKERSRILHRARLEALRVTGNVREALVDAALDRTRGRLASMRTDIAYRAVLCRLVQEALAELKGSLGGASQDGQKVCLHADRRDHDLFDSLLLDMWLDLPVSYDLECWGGLVAESEDGRVVVINTLEARLERATPLLRHYLAALFEDSQIEARAGRPADRRASQDSGRVGAGG